MTQGAPASQYQLDRYYPLPEVPSPPLLSDDTVTGLTFKIMWYLEALGREHPSIVTLETIGHSVENRAIVLLKVSNGPRQVLNPVKRRV